MNVQTPILQGSDAFQRAEREADQRRGQLINLYARAENCITGALRTSDKKIPMLFSQKIAQLKIARTDDKALLGQLQDLEDALGERNSLVHGVGRIWIDRRGKWLLLLSHHGSKGTVDFALSQDESKGRHDKLHRLVQSLSAKLEN